jgi:hypothetical protein
MLVSDLRVTIIVRSNSQILSVGCAPKYEFGGTDEAAQYRAVVASHTPDAW